ncbi:MAG: tRNA dihydrouridine synthase DusB [Bdellovibrionales bacterium RBG_16_40_8]|nr:MAG: tRNA dihydrouridine synthase DusB [Bdellovibrionales bacterium RBG_16_40_8]
MNLLAYLKKNPFVLAPMAGITDCAFRSFMRELGAGIVITELVSATGLKHLSARTRKLMQFDGIQHPVGVQLFGGDISDLVMAAKEVEQMGADFVDLNFGCPVPKVVKRGAGSAALRDLIFLRDVLRAVKKAVKIPATIKIRTGWDEKTRNTHEVAQIAYDEGITWVAIHGRTRAQGYAGQADWDYIREVKTKASVPILGNGDIVTAIRANQRLQESGCDGAMIGRGCLKNPWIFKESNILFSENIEMKFNKNFSLLFDLLQSHLVKSHDLRMTALQTKKLAAWYSAGYPDSAQFRKNIFTLSDLAEVTNLAKDYFQQISCTVQHDTSSEPFLMGGHG